MREIKFRAYSRNQKIMIEHKKMTNLPEFFAIIMADPDAWILMQFIGLYDKKGNEIFEGDIVQWKNKWPTGPVKTTEVIETILEAYALDGSEEMETIKVIGNIYQNPNLIK